MTEGLHRFYGGNDLHFLTFSCYRRPLFGKLVGNEASCDLFLKTLDRVYRHYRLVVLEPIGMPEHIHSTNRWRILCKPLHPLVTSVPASDVISRRFVDEGCAGNGTQPADPHLGRCAREASMAKLERVKPEPTKLEPTKLEQPRSRN